MSAQVAANLRAAAEVLRRDGWTQGKFTDPETGCHCVGGAIAVAAADGDTFTDEWAAGVRAMYAVIPDADWPTDVYKWNDEPERTADEVIAALEAAADTAEAEL